MNKCSICGRPITHNLAVYLNNNIPSAHGGKQIIRATICKSCISKMNTHLNELEENIEDDNKELTNYINHIQELLNLYMHGVEDVVKDKEVPIYVAFFFEQEFIKHISDKNYRELLEYILKDSIETVYEANHWVDLPMAMLKSELNKVFDLQLEELKEQILSTDFDFNDGALHTKTSVEYKESTEETNPLGDIQLTTPSKIKAELDKYIIGQEKAKKIVSVGIYNHYKRIKSDRKDIKKSNIMLIGATGSGKTEIARTVAKILNVPFCIADATSITSAGYVGEDAENMLLKLIQVADGDIEKAEHGIIYIDEIDKIARTGESSTHKDVGGEGVQQALLKIVEGSDVNIQVKGKGPFSETITINTENILFICGGAFENITMHEDKTKLGIGFNSTEVSDKIETIDSKILVKNGMIPELVGRFPIIAKLDTLEIEDLKRILVEPTNSVVKQYKELVGIDKVKLNFTEDALSWIAKKAYDNKTGARGLKTIIEDSMLDLMYDLPDETDISSVQVGVKDNVLNIKKTKKRVKKSIDKTY